MGHRGLRLRDLVLLSLAPSPGNPIWRISSAAGPGWAVNRTVWTLPPSSRVSKWLRLLPSGRGNRSSVLRHWRCQRPSFPLKDVGVAEDTAITQWWWGGGDGYKRARRGWGQRESLQPGTLMACPIMGANRCRCCHFVSLLLSQLV